MALPPLQWRKLPARVITTASVDTSYFLNTIYDILTGSLYYDGSARVIGSGSAWRNATKFVTGSNTEAIYCFPPTNTAMSQSIIFASKNFFGASSSALPATASNGDVWLDFSSGVRQILMADVKLARSESFTEWTSRYPFGSSSFSTGYFGLTQCGRWYATASFPNQYSTKVSVYEATEAMLVAVSFNNRLGAHIGVAGAIIDPEDVVTSVDAEIDNRIYAISTNGGGSAGLSSNFCFLGKSTGASTEIYVATSSLFTHHSGSNDMTGKNDSSSYSKFVAFIPQAQSTFALVTEKQGIRYNSPGAYSALSYMGYSGKFVQRPLKCIESGSSYYVGKLRDMNVATLGYLNQIIKNPSNQIIGFTINSSEYISSNVSGSFGYASGAASICLSYN